MKRKKKEKNSFIWIKFKILVVVWVIKQGLDFMMDFWDPCAADLRSELAGIAQLLLSWKMGNELGSLEEVSGFILIWNDTVVNKSLVSQGRWCNGSIFGLVEFSLASLLLKQKYPKTFLLAWQCAAHWSGSFRYFQIEIISVTVSQNVINGSQSHWKSWGDFQYFNNWSVVCTCA